MPVWEMQSLGIIGSSHRVGTQKTNPQAVNLVDAAVAKPIDENDVLNEIIEIGTVQGTDDGFLGMSVRKSGRTTSFTTGPDHSNQCNSGC